MTEDDWEPKPKKRIWAYRPSRRQAFRVLGIVCLAGLAYFGFNMARN